MAPKDAHVLIPRTCECIILDGKRDFAHVIKLRILRWWHDAELFWWVQCHLQGSWEEGGRRVRVREGDVMTEAEVRVLRPQGKEWGQALQTVQGDLLKGNIIDNTLILVF